MENCWPRDVTHNKVKEVERWDKNMFNIVTESETSERM